MARRSESLDWGDVQSCFVDPENPKSCDDLSELGSEAIKFMAEIYASGGDPDKLSKDSMRWLAEETDDGLPEVLRRILQEEMSTRRFDNRFMGQIHPQSNKIAVLGHLVAAYMNTNTVVAEVSMAENRMEARVLSWLAEIFGYDAKSFSGNVLSGGTMANHASLWVAREWTNERLRASGVLKRKRDSRPLYVLVNGMAHYSVVKSCDQLGLRILPLQRDGYKTNVDSVKRGIVRVRKAGGEVAAIVALAGETETGLVDNLNGIADVAEEYGVFLHVDAAYGGPFILSRVGHLFEGINRADSITVDPHKMMYVPYQAGVVLFKDRRKHMLIEKGMRRRARYLLRNEERFDNGGGGDVNFGLSRPEGSLGSGGVIATWGTIQLLGKDGLRLLLDHTLDLVEHGYRLVSDSDVLRPVHKPEINTILIGLRERFSLTEREVNLLQERLFNGYGYYISCNGEVDGGRPAFRFVPMHPFTTRQDVEGMVVALEREVVSYFGL